MLEKTSIQVQESSKKNIQTEKLLIAKHGDIKGSVYVSHLVGSRGHKSLMKEGPCKFYMYETL